MKIAIISDIHDNIPRLEESFLISKKEKVETCFCCGDISNTKTLEKISNNFKKSYIALGNMDFELKDRLEYLPKNIICSTYILELKIDEIKVALTHYDSTARELAKKNVYDFVFYGHTHTPWEERIENTIIINPGELSGQFGQASFAIFDTKTKKIKLKIIS